MMFMKHSLSVCILAALYAASGLAAALPASKTCTGGSNPTSVPAPPLPQTPTPFDSSVIIPNITPDQVLAAAPNSSCINPRFGPEECTNSKTVAYRLNKAFHRFDLPTLGQKAALLSYMAFESGDFVANINHFPAPGRPGQGTKMMIMFPGLYDFAKSFQKNHKIIKANSPGGVIMDQVKFDTFNKDFTPEQQMAIRATVLPEKYTFQAAPWFLRNNVDCPRDTADKLANGGEEGFIYFHESCLFVKPVDEGRVKKWCDAVKVLKPAGMEMPARCVV